MMNRALRGLIIAMCMVTLIGCSNMKFNQTASKNDLLTEKYPIIQIEKLKSTAEAGNITFSDFKRDFNVQCIRKTHQGYYVVLLLEDDGNAFAFFNEKNSLVRVMVLDSFKSKIEFENQIMEQMPKSEVLNFDPNTIIAPISALEITAHIVQEGIFIVKYSRFRDGEIIDNPIVTSIQFIDNDSISMSEDPFVRDEIPFIFEFDKTEETNGGELNLVITLP